MPETRLLLLLTSFGLALAAREALRRMRRQSLNGQVAVITGSSRGLGLAIARELTRAGCRIVLSARDEQELERARQDIESLGGTVVAIPCDVTQREQVRSLIRQSLDRFGSIDILVNNAGAISVSPLEAQTLDDFEHAMAVIFWGTVYPTLEVLPHMRQRRAGHVVNITSVGGKVSVPHLASYSAAKFAAVGFSEGLHTELAPAGIHVLTVVPGLMRTGSHVNAEFKGQQRKEFAWFSLVASLAITSIGADDAARRIVSALETVETEIILTWQAAVAARLQGVMPGFTTDVLTLINRLLPDAAGGETEARPGWASRSSASDSVLTKPGEQAADDLNQR